MFNFGKKKQVREEVKELDALIQEVEAKMRECLANGDTEKYWECHRMLEKLIEDRNGLCGAPPSQSEKVDGEFTKRRFLELLTDPKMWATLLSTGITIGAGIGYSKYINEKEENGELVDTRLVDKATKPPRFKP